VVFNPSVDAHPTGSPSEPTVHPAVHFAQAARRIHAAARAAGLVVPAFRSPPRRPGEVRTIRRLPGGSVVAVAVRGRPFRDIARDMVDGVLAANRLSGAGATRVRAALLAAVTDPAPDRSAAA
jgi:hypothetical protein